MEQYKDTIERLKEKWGSSPDKEQDNLDGLRSDEMKMGDLVRYLQTPWPDAEHSTLGMVKSQNALDVFVHWIDHWDKKRIGKTLREYSFNLRIVK